MSAQNDGSRNSAFTLKVFPTLPNCVSRAVDPKQCRKVFQLDYRPPPNWKIILVQTASMLGHGRNISKGIVYINLQHVHFVYTA